MRNNDIKLRTLITLGRPSADVDFLAALQKFVERDTERRSRIVRDWLAIRIDGIQKAVIDWESWCLIEFEGSTSKVEIVGRDAEGEVVIATYLPTYDGPKTEAWKVSLPWGDEVSCTFEYDDQGCVRLEAKRIVKPKFFGKHAQQAIAPEPGFAWFDKAYVDRLRNGDPATEHHFIAYFDRLLHIKLRARALPSDRVEELTQETLTRVITALRRGREVREGRFSTFVISICNRVLLEYYRAATAKNCAAAEEAYVEIPDGVLDRDATLGGKQSAEHVRQILKGMPRRDRDLLRAILFEERDKASVCREFGVDRDYLRVLVLRAKDKFKDNWADLAPVWDNLLSQD